MRRVYLFLALTFFAFGLNAQNVQVTFEDEVVNVDDTVNIEILPDVTFKSYFYIENITESPISAMAKYTKILSEEGDEFLMCFGECTIGNVAGPVTLNPGEIFEGFDIEFTPTNTNNRLLKVELYEELTNDILHQYYVKYYSETGLEQAKSNSFYVKAYPNPANNHVKISYSIPNKYSAAKIVVRNMVGQVIEQYDAKVSYNASLNINTSDFVNGVYFYSVIADGVTLSTKKLVVKH
ncbi:MAG TPA: T9SS type A sorting domain-containing protein [Candidatus Onthomorpha intestinigallinarum]|uniref:T9SS type A sorting domain-containing protein n=1 Tax=Candidatus Onthomorpha intestinigallinarum TaxID=2840880 RepID=A0A9D1UHI8_9BACT|nr:T9SS type A sorting domain-containing protein [Candidatus Onthomorpha intestinigallinarum]